MSNNNSNLNSEPLQEAEVKEVVDKWVDILKIPVVAGAYVNEDDNFLNVVSKWSVDDAAKKEKLTFSRTFSVLQSSLEKGNPVVSSPGSVNVDEKLCVVSNCGKMRAVLTEKSGENSSKTEFLHIWDEKSLLKTYNLTELDLHKTVYTSPGWGITMAWSQNGTKLAYLAEKKVPKAKSFYSSAALPTKPKEESAQKKEEKSDIGEEYIYKQTWGEQLNEQYQSVIVVLDLTASEFKVLNLPEGNFPTDIQWINDTRVVGTTYPLPVWRLGLIYCTNRESIIFSIQDNGDNFQLLSAPGKACRSPRVRPDGGYVVWQERKLDGPHERARSVMGLSLNQGQPVGEPQLVYELEPQSKVPIYADFTRRCWSLDGSTLFAVTPNEGKMVCLALTMGSTLAQVKKINDVDNLLWITREYLLVSSSTTVSSPILKLLKINQDFLPLPVTQPTQPLSQTLVQFVYGDTSPPAIFHGPPIETVSPNSVPLIVWPHGGPHATFVDSFLPEAVLFLKLGFAILRLNYVGSTGGIKDTADELLGKIGDRDLKDCQGIVNKVLNSMPSLNPEKVVVFGGSHGGFLTAHLSSSYPDVYKAAVLRNPVTDLATMVGTSDIIDWIYAESGIPFPVPPVQTLIPAARDLAEAEKYLKVSPIHHAEKVKGATLLLLGSEDLRVPAQQGLCYYRALKAHNKIAEVRMYPDAHPLSKVPVRFDSIIHSAVWFKRYIR